MTIAGSSYDLNLFRLNNKKWIEWLNLYKKEIGFDNYSNLESRKRTMEKVNPRYILRNWQVQQAIIKCQNKECQEITEIAQMISSPFDYNEKYEKYFEKQPKWAKGSPGFSMLSCSS